MKLKILAKNVQSIFSDIRESGLIESLINIQWDIIFLTETWRKTKEEVWKTHDGHLFMGSGWAEGRRGVAILIHRNLLDGFRCFYATSERVCAADVDIRGTRLRLITAYIPDGSYSDSAVEATYD